MPTDEELSEPTGGIHGEPPTPQGEGDEELPTGEARKGLTNDENTYLRQYQELAEETEDAREKAQRYDQFAALLAQNPDAADMLMKGMTVEDVVAARGISGSPTSGSDNAQDIVDRIKSGDETALKLLVRSRLFHRTAFDYGGRLLS